jgi:hypothetical protein
MWKPKPSNWRQRWWYKPPSFRRLDSDRNIKIDDDYLDWLTAKYDWPSRQDARDHVANTQRPCGLISERHNLPPAEEVRQQVSMF